MENCFLERLTDEICEVMELNHSVEICYWENGELLVENGSIHYLDLFLKQLRIVNTDNRVVILNLKALDKVTPC